MPGADSGAGKKEQCEMREKERERDDMRWHNNSRHISDTEGLVCGLMCSPGGRRCSPQARGLRRDVVATHGGMFRCSRR